MKTFITLMLTILTGVSLTLVTINEADAKRMGGGRSFGGKSAFNSPYKGATPSRQMNTPATPAQQKNAQLRQSFSQRGGLMGMIGGLALGGLLGALLFGGAFENINFLDILMFGGLGFLGYRLFAARRRGASQEPVAQSGGDGVATAPDPMANAFRSRGAAASGQRNFDTDLLFKNKPGSVGSFDAAKFQSTSLSERPEGFDEQAFLQGAEGAYRQLQNSWDQGDLTGIRRLTTEAVFKELEPQLQGRQGENRTEILQLHMELLGVEETEGQWQAAVLFDTRLREIDENNKAAQNPQWIKEVWHFTRSATSDKPTWYLDGIQQVEE